MSWFRKANNKAEANDNQATPADGASFSPDRFSELVVAATGDRTGAGMQTFWRAVFELEQWYFLQQIPPDMKTIEGPPPFGHPNPIACRVEGKLFVVAFTSADRASAAARHNGLIHPQFGIPLLAIPRDAAAQLLCRMDDGRIDGVLFNQNVGEQGAFAPLHNIAAMYEYQFDRLPVGMFDSLAKAVTSGNQPQAWARLNRRLMLMEQWFFIGDKDRPTAPQIYRTKQEDLVVLVFTDPQSAAAGSAATGTLRDDGQPWLIPSTPAEAISHLRNVQQQSNGQMRNVLFNLGRTAFTLTIDDLCRFLTFSG